jgi:hypothetical protein
MFPRASSSCSFVVALFALAACPAVSAQLVSKSPFLPPQTAETNAPTVGAPLEYQGYITTGQGAQYRIYDPARKAGTWVKLNQRDSTFDVTAKQHNGENGTLVIEHQGKTLTLAEKKAKVVSAGTAQMTPPPAQVAPAPPQNVAPAVTQAVVLNPTPADEQRRLEAVATEVARRRALREQATQQIGQGVAPQVTVPQPGQVQQRNAQPNGNIPGVTVPGRIGPVSPTPQLR